MFVVYAPINVRPAGEGGGGGRAWGGDVIVFFGPGVGRVGLSLRLTIQKETDDGFYLGFSLFAPSMIVRIPEICL